MQQAEFTLIIALPAYHLQTSGNHGSSVCRHTAEVSKTKTKLSSSLSDCEKCKIRLSTLK